MDPIGSAVLTFIKYKQTDRHSIVYIYIKGKKNYFKYSIIIVFKEKRKIRLKDKICTKSKNVKEKRQEN